VFVLLAGTSAGLMTARRRPRELTKFLLTRGVWLVFVEWCVVATAFTFDPRGIPQVGGLVLVPMQVIWAIGASMIVLALVQRLGRSLCLATGIAIIVLHNLLDPVWPPSQQFDQTPPLWVALHGQMAHTVGPFLLLFVYPLLPWIGVMLLGFGIAALFGRPAEERTTILFWGGLGLTAAFVALRALDLYGDPNPWQVQPVGITATVIAILYPLSRWVAGVKARRRDWWLSYL
jgi:uncharacterized membrane protein